MNAETTRRKSGRPSVADARAAAQAAAKSTKASTTDKLEQHFAGREPGRVMLRVDIAATVVFTVVTAAAVVFDTRALRIVVGYIVDMPLFAVGCLLFLLALYNGAQRSREAEMTMAGWWWLTGVAPPRVRLTLLGCLAIQTIVGFAGASIRLYTATAFGVLVPTFGLALCGLWSAAYGMFPKRQDLR